MRIGNNSAAKTEMASSPEPGPEPSAPQVLERLLAEDTFPGKDGRQIAIADYKGNLVTHTGPNAPNWAGGRKGQRWVAQGKSNTVIADILKISDDTVAFYLRGALRKLGVSTRMQAVALCVTFGLIT